MTEGQPKTGLSLPELTPKDRRLARAITAVTLAFRPILCRCFPRFWARISVTLIHNAAFVGDEIGLIRLLELGVDPDTREEMIQATPLSSAAAHGNIRAAEILLAAGSDVNAEDSGRQTALMVAAQFGHTELVEYLLKVGADLHAQETSFGHNALFSAAGGGHLETVRLLLERGANPTAVMKGNITAAVWARMVAFKPHPEAQLACADYLEQWQKEQQAT